MRKRQLMALAAAGLLAVQMPMTSMAQISIDGTPTTETEHKGDVTSISSDGKATEKDSLTVYGDVNNSGGKGVDAKGNTEINVKDNPETTAKTEGNVAGNYGVYADGANVTVEGTVKGSKYNGIDAKNGSTVTAGSVEGKSVAVRADSSTVTVTGAVKSSNDKGIFALNSTVTADSAEGKNYGIYAQSSTVTVNGAATSSEGIGIRTLGGSTVTAGSADGKQYGVDAGSGTVTVNGAATSSMGIGIKAGSGATVTAGSADGKQYGVMATVATVTVNGAVTSSEGIGIKANDGSTVTAENVKAGSTGITTNSDAKVYVTGDVTGSESSIKLEDATNNSSFVEILGNTTGSILFESETGAAKSAATVIVNSITPTGGQGVVNFWSETADTAEEVQEKAKTVAENNIYYIVNTEKTDHGTITITKASNMVEVKNADGTVKTDANGNTLYAANRTQTVTVKIEAANGYTVKSTDGGKATITKNADGSYTLTIPEGGGVDISAVIEAINRGSSDDGRSSSYASKTIYSNGTVSGAQNWNSNNGAWTYNKGNGTLAKSEWIQSEFNGVKGWYHFGADAVMNTGWLQDNGNWYYLNPVSNGLKGMMQTGWFTDPATGYRYYFDPNTGAMAVGDYVVDGVSYHFTANAAEGLPVGALK